MSAYVDRTTPGGYQSNTIMRGLVAAPGALRTGGGKYVVQLASWTEHTGTVAVNIDHEDVPAYAAALLAEYVKIEALLAEQERREAS